MSKSEFSGFPAAGLKFLDDLAANNNREWFEAHKSVYKTQLEAPAQALVAALGSRLQAISDGIIVDTRANGGGSLTRIYRDIRFSKDKTPYHTHLDMLFWQGAGKKSENPIFGMRLEAGGWGILTGMYQFDRPMLNTYREAVADDKLGSELVTALAAVKQAGEYRIGNEGFKRIPAGYADDHPRADLLRYDGLYAIYDGADGVLLTSPNLVEVCVRHCVNMAPIFKWLVKIRQ